MALSYRTEDDIQPAPVNDTPIVGITATNGSEEDAFSEQDTRNVIVTEEYAFSEQDTRNAIGTEEDTFSEQDTRNSIATDADATTTEEQEGPEVLAAKKRARIKKILIGLTLVALVIFVIIDSTSNRYVAKGIQTFLEWFEKNPVAGLFAFMGVYFLATVLFIPGSILTLGAGFVFANAFGLGWGVLLATVSVFFGAVAGDITSFLLGRYLLRDWVQGWTQKYPIFKAIDKGEKHRTMRNTDRIITAICTATHDSLPF